MRQDLIVILDLGSTENTVLAREIRSLGVYSEIHPHDITAEELRGFKKVGTVKGGEKTYYDDTSVKTNVTYYYKVQAYNHNQKMEEP